MPYTPSSHDITNREANFFPDHSCATSIASLIALITLLYRLQLHHCFSCYTTTAAAAAVTTSLLKKKQYRGADGRFRLFRECVPPPAKKKIETNEIFSGNNSFRPE